MTGGWLAEGSWPHRCSTRGAQLLGIVLVKGDGLPKGKGLPKVRWFLRDGRWIIVPTRYSPGNTRLLGRMAWSGDRAPQAVYRKCRGLRSGPCTARQGEPRSGERALWRVFPFSALRKGGAPAGAQRSGSGGERRNKGAGAVSAARRKRSLADFATTTWGVHCTSHHHG